MWILKKMQRQMSAFMSSSRIHAASITSSLCSWRVRVRACVRACACQLAY